MLEQPGGGGGEEMKVLEVSCNNRLVLEEMEVERLEEEGLRRRRCNTR